MQEPDAHFLFHIHLLQNLWNQSKQSKFSCQKNNYMSMLLCVMCNRHSMTISLPGLGGFLQSLASINLNMQHCNYKKQYVDDESVSKS